MKKTILLFAVGFGIVSLTSCARGYGCPYTMEENNQNERTELVVENAQKNTESEKSGLIQEEIETFDTEAIAD